MSHSQLFVSRAYRSIYTCACSLLHSKRRSPLCWRKTLLPCPGAKSRAPFPTSIIAAFLSTRVHSFASFFFPFSSSFTSSSESSSSLLHLAQDHLSAFHVSQRAVAQTRRFVTRQFRARRRHALLEARVRELRDHFVEHRFAFLLLEEPLHVRVHGLGRHVLYLLLRKTMMTKGLWSLF